MGAAAKQISSARSPKAPAAYTILEETAVPVGLEFGASGKTSHYRAALEQLDAAGEGRVMQFAGVKCRGQVAAAAKKLGIRVEFAERDGRLYVRHAGDRIETGSLRKVKPKPVQSVPDGKPSTITDAVKQAVAETPRTNAEVLDFVKRAGFESDGSVVSTLLGQLRIKGYCYKSDEDLKWHLAAGVKR